MKYVIMLALVMGLALADWCTGFIKAYVNNDIKSVKMRTGGMKKLAELTIMLVGIGIDISIGKLSEYYPDAKALGDILSNFTAIIVCCYITLMELVSILENFAAIYPEADWAARISKRLSNIDEKKKEDDKDANDK